MISLPLLGAAALLLSYFGVARLRVWAERRRLLDIPNERSSHKRPIPRAGGLAIVVVTLVGGALFVWVGEAIWRSFLPYLFGALLIVAVSWLDDVRSVPNRLRFCAHSASALLGIWAYGPWLSVSIPIWGEAHLGLLAVPITFLW